MENDVSNILYSKHTHVKLVISVYVRDCVWRLGDLILILTLCPQVNSILDINLSALFLCVQNMERLSRILLQFTAGIRWGRIEAENGSSK